MRFPWQQPRLTEADARALAKLRPCAYCGGIHIVHDIACPRLKSVVYSEGGETVMQVEYWSAWDKSQTVWLDRVYEQAEPEKKAEP